MVAEMGEGAMGVEDTVEVEMEAAATDRRCFPSVCATQLLVDSYGINCKFAVHMPRHVTI